MADKHHHHDDAHAPIEEPQGPPGEDELLEVALRELLVERGVLSAGAVDQQIDVIESRNPALGAQVVARAWTDPAFHQALLSNPLDTLEKAFQLPMSGPVPVDLKVLENTPAVHNVVVCTLCSCYPRMLLGPPPAWYRASAYRSRVVREPRAVLREFGLELPDSVEVRVSDSTADMRYLVLPRRPEGTDGWSLEALSGLVTRDCMIGTAVPRDPSIEAHGLTTCEDAGDEP
ncbi:nitrile hydratase [Natronocella acetinitrilica]|uniref:Nitrile hydratase n=1 Tax=Natronocella acetinitrilica TaxID=414046 RepID=A0AAE3G0N9_9GAMM|nr:nitrile hydratase subunit alpha [Natronocella acetinitrilica]MCP1673411.1 nitrile hydratase [Natronocella acetinitrilica]